MTFTELDLVNDLKSLLARHGRVEMVYLTAEFQPFSNGQRPDLVFVPNSGGWCGQTAIIEFKVTERPRRSGRSFQNIIEHKEFCEEALEKGLFRYIFVTVEEVPEFSLEHLRQHGIMVIRFNGDITATADVILREFLSA